MCDVCGGLNALGNVSVKVDCTACSQTGYQNFFTTVTVPAYYRPGVVKRWNIQRGGYDLVGDMTIKVDAQWASLLERSTHLDFKGVAWHFTQLRDPGAAMGQERIVLALYRKG